MPEIHVINGEPRECSDAITARGLTEEWLANPEATETKVAAMLADEAAERAANPVRPKHETSDDADVAFVSEPDTSSGATPPRRRRR